MAPDTATLPASAMPMAVPITEHPALPEVVAEPAASLIVEPAGLEFLDNRIAELSARIQAATYELLCYLREFDRRYGWEGFRSCAHWLNWRTGLDLGAAREKMRVAEALADLNHVSAAMACGRLSYSKVRALTRVATPTTEARLVAVACGSTAAQVERLVRAWRQADRAAQPDAELVRLASRMLSTRVDEDGMVLLRARFTPEVGAVVLRALEAALEQVPVDAEGDDLSIGQRRADAMRLVAESALAGGLDPGAAGDRYQVTVHVDADRLPRRDCAPCAPYASAETPAMGARASEPGAPVTASDSAAESEAAAPVVIQGDASPAGVGISAEERVAPAVARSAPVRTAVFAETPMALAVESAAPVRASAIGSDADGVSVHLESEDGFRVSAGVCGCRETAPGPGLDAGQAVIEQAGGLHIGANVARRIACDAGLVMLYHGTDGEVLDVGRRTRTVPTALRRALAGRDANQCQFPGCDSRRCDAHHVEHWADGGATRLANLVSLCRFHHRTVHESGFQVVADAAGQFRFLRPDGEPMPAVPPAARWEGAGEPLAPTVARLEEAGVTIGPHTATPEWYGEKLDVTAALDALWEPRQRTGTETAST